MPQSHDSTYPFLRTVNRMILSGAKPVTEEIAPDSSISLDAILTPLLRDTGRFTEKYTTDFIISWNEFENAVRRIRVPEAKYMAPQIFVFGIRELGVDGNEFTFSRIKDLKARYLDFYRRLYAVRVYVANSEHFSDYPELHVELWDIRNQIRLSDFSEREVPDNLASIADKDSSDSEKECEYNPHFRGIPEDETDSETEKRI